MLKNSYISLLANIYIKERIFFYENIRRFWFIYFQGGGHTAWPLKRTLSRDFLGDNKK